MNSPTEESMISPYVNLKPSTAQAFFWPCLLLFFVIFSYSSFQGCLFTPSILLAGNHIFFPCIRVVCGRIL
ncbi:hypothetical protein B0T13DRAFT_469358 [Neurospora crassa]|nr:hypothetical protein B0T13DRAFT_469358 [Neurospora crassa]